MDRSVVFPGLKIFIINSDLRKKDQDQMVSEMFLNGYELYFTIAKNGAVISDQLRVIAESFEEVIALVNIDRSLNDVPDYVTFMKNLIKRFSRSEQYLNENGIEPHNLLKLGSVHTVSPNTQNREHEKKIESKYLFDVRVPAGFLVFGADMRKNTLDFFNILDAHQYLRGYRRSTVRAICGGSSQKVVFVHEKETHNYRLEDISISHFSCIVPNESVLPIFTKIEDIQISLKMAILKTNCILSFVKAAANSSSLCVFTFMHYERTRSGQQRDIQGLSEENRIKVNACIVDQLQNRMSDFMMAAFTR